MIFVDSNIPMYLVGEDQGKRDIADSVVRQLIANGTAMVTDAEVLQEILHRYLALRRPAAIRPAFDALTEVVDQTYPVTANDLFHAERLSAHALDLSTRDLLHWAVMRRYGVSRILTFDRDFDRCPGLERIC